MGPTFGSLHQGAAGGKSVREGLPLSLWGPGYDPRKFFFENSDAKSCILVASALISNNTCCEISSFLKTTAKTLGDQYIVGPPTKMLERTSLPRSPRLLCLCSDPHKLVENRGFQPGFQLDRVVDCGLKKRIKEKVHDELTAVKWVVFYPVTLSDCNVFVQHVYMYIVCWLVSIAGWWNCCYCKTVWTWATVRTTLSTNTDWFSAARTDKTIVMFMVDFITGQNNSK